MLLRKIILLFSFLFIFHGVFSQGTIKTMFYNVFEFPEAPPSNRTELLRDIIQFYDPDIFMICELQNDLGADLILNNSLNIDNVLYERAPFIANQSGPAELHQMVFFKSDKFSLETVDVIVTNVRDINRYQLKVNTDDQATNPLFIDLYVAHLKSSTGTANQQERLQMVTQFTDYISNLDASSYFIFAGDLNVYTASEPAYQHLLNPGNPVTFQDPLDAPGSWQDNANFAYLHTQSTRLSSGGFGGGAGAGLDDRFDFILLSENMFDNPELMYVEDTYKAFGNNGNCLNNRIDSPDCDGFYDQNLRDRLYLMSDHLPVVMDLQTDRNILSNTSVAQSELIKFPRGNMAADYLYIQVDPSIQQNIAFEIFNVLGQRIKSVKNNNSTEYQVNVSGFAKGIYYITSTHLGNTTYKFIKK
tara:strand:+ start:25793 stop:27040 length:1248 start_codon:yes stop_codon:yes gene_type:complete